jgi:hypothetical protein
MKGYNCIQRQGAVAACKLINDPGGSRRLKSGVKTTDSCLPLQTLWLNRSEAIKLPDNKPRHQKTHMVHETGFESISELEKEGGKGFPNVLRLVTTSK